MKKIILIVLIISAMSCKAQNSIVPLTEKYNIPDNYTGVYFKDVDNDLNSFEGTWKYQNGSTTFTIKFRKIIQYYNGTWYADKLIGDYQYIQNGVELVNCLPDFNNPNVNDAQHNIKGNKFIYKNWFPRCEECNESDRRFVLRFYDPDRLYLYSELAVRYFIENGVEKIKVWLYDSASAVLPYEGAPEVIRVPYGEYVLVKQ